MSIEPACKFIPKAQPITSINFVTKDLKSIVIALQWDVSDSNLLTLYFASLGLRKLLVEKIIQVKEILTTNSVDRLLILLGDINKNQSWTQ